MGPDPYRGEDVSDEASAYSVDCEEQAFGLILTSLGALTVVLAAIGASPTGMTLGFAFALLGFVALLCRRRG